MPLRRFYVITTDDWSDAPPPMRSGEVLDWHGCTGVWALPSDQLPLVSGDVVVVSAHNDMWSAQLELHANPPA